MSTSNNLPLNATARLTMQVGNPCSIAEFAMYLDQYEYAQDRNDPHRWYLNDPDVPNAADCSIVIHDLSSPVSVIDVFGQGNEHYSNLNYLMQRAGWESCTVVCQSEDISVRMLARFVSVEVESDITLPASSLDANERMPTLATFEVSPVLNLVDDVAQPTIQSAPQPAADNSHGHETAIELEAASSSHRIRELTINLNTAQERLAILEDENTALREREDALQAKVRELSQQLARNQGSDLSVQSAAAVEPLDSLPLLRIIEEHLLPSIDISSTASSKVMADLRAAGYSFQLRLVRTASQS